MLRWVGVINAVAAARRSMSPSWTNCLGRRRPSGRLAVRGLTSECSSSRCSHSRSGRPRSSPPATARRRQRWPQAARARGRSLSSWHPSMVRALRPSGGAAVPQKPTPRWLCGVTCLPVAALFFQPGLHFCTRDRIVGDTVKKCPNGVEVIFAALYALPRLIDHIEGGWNRPSLLGRSSPIWMLGIDTLLVFISANSRVQGLHIVA
jgi:hypothetical protein